MYLAVNLALYGGLALTREILAIFYYKAIIARLAGLVSGLNLLIDLLDFFVLSLILAAIFRAGSFMPAVIYACFSSLGAYIGMKLRK
jgi:hypothetical protein